MRHDLPGPAARAGPPPRFPCRPVRAPCEEGRARFRVGRACVLSGQMEATVAPPGSLLLIVFAILTPLTSGSDATDLTMLFDNDI